MGFLRRFQYEHLMVIRHIEVNMYNGLPHVDSLGVHPRLVISESTVFMVYVIASDAYLVAPEKEVQHQVS